MSRLAPWLALAVMLGFSRALPPAVQRDDTAPERRRAIAAAMDGVPFFLGAWVGREEDVPPEAQKLLKPNAILSRTYRRPGGLSLHVLVVHCADARDMIGHYPPVCYPSAGWMAEDADGPADAEIALAGTRLPVRLYRFRRMRDRGLEDRIRIFNAFIMPGGNASREISDINRQSERRAVSAQGVAQVQIISPATVPRDEALSAAGELLGAMDELLAALQVGEGAWREP